MQVSSSIPQSTFYLQCIFYLPKEKIHEIQQLHFFKCTFKHSLIWRLHLVTKPKYIYIKCTSFRLFLKVFWRGWGDKTSNSLQKLSTTVERACLACPAVFYTNVLFSSQCFFSTLSLPLSVSPYQSSVFGIASSLENVSYEVLTKTSGHKHLNTFSFCCLQMQSELDRNISRELNNGEYTDWEMLGIACHLQLQQYDGV